jgi:hypothetical protein
VCGVSFTAPQSGHVLVQAYFDLAPASAQTLIGGWRLRTGTTVGAGTLTDGTETSDGVHAVTGRVIADSRAAAGGKACRVTGLTPGTSYNVATYHYVSGGTTSTVFTRGITVIPLL